MRFLWNWLLQVAFRFLRVQPTLLGPGKHKLQELNDDVLREIFAAQELGLEDRLQVSLVSHRFRTLVRPLIFSQCTWSPWLGACSFLPQTLWAHIRVLNFDGELRILDSHRRRFMVWQLEPAIRGLTAAHTFTLTAMKGGLWPELLDTIAAAPVLRHLIIKHMPWDGDDRDVFDFPPTLRLPPIRELAYICPYAIDESRRRPFKTKRPPHMLESEVHNLRVVLRACHSSLESLMLPGELILRSLDASLRWTSLRELRLQGYWPDPAEVSLYSVLRLLSNLRIVSLRCESSDEVSDLGYSNPIVSSELSTQSDMFLRKLQTFELASLVPSDRILSLLPPGLQKLSVIAYPVDIDANCGSAAYRYTRNTCCASDLLNIFSGVHYPAVTRLELWYRADVSDADFLLRLPEVFPSLRYLEVHRFTPYDMDDQWNPARTFQTVLPHFKKLRLFALEPDDPHRRYKIIPRGMVPRNAKYIRRLGSIAEEMVLLTPWLQEIWISVRFADDVRWERWDIVSAPGEKIRLRSPCAAETLHPQIYAILEGPLEDAESDPEPV